MDPRELDALAHRLGENANDTDALNTAYAYGQKDPRAYALFLEKVGQVTRDPATGAHWYCEAATVWTASLSDAQRAERALMLGVDKDPLHAGATGRLVELYREKGSEKSIATLHQRRAKSIEKRLGESPELAEGLAEVYSELARVLVEELGQPDRAVAAYKKAAEHNPKDIYAIYQARELLKNAGKLKEALPLFAAEQALLQGDPARAVALYHDEAEVCRQLGDRVGLVRALRGARALDTTDDATLKQQLGTAILEIHQAGEPVEQSELDEATALFVSLAETYDGEHGFSYSLCALELQADNDRAAQLAMYYGEQTQRALEAAPAIARYLSANPNGAVAPDARDLVARALNETGDETLIAALSPSQDADVETQVAALSTIAQALVAKGKQRDATEHYRRIVELSPAHEEAVAFLADSLRSKDETALCELLFAAAQVESTPTEQRRAWFSEVAVLCEGPLQDVDGAIEARRQLVLLDPSDEEAADHLELTLEKAAKWADLADLLARRADVDPDDESKLARELRVADLYQNKLENPGAAAEALARAVSIDPEDEERSFEAVRLFLASDRSDRARLLLEELLGRKVSTDTRARYSERLAELLVDAGHLAEAGGAYAEAASGMNDAALWKRAQTCFAHGENWEQAARCVGERRDLASEDAEKALLCNEEADFLEKLGDIEGALAILVRALEFDAKNRDISERLETAYIELGRSQELIDLLLARANTLDEFQERVATRKRVAFIQRDQMHDSEGMRQALLLVLDDQEDPESLEILADLAESQANTVETVDFLRRLEAVVSGGARQSVALRLARLLEEEGDEAGALEQYQTALEAEPESVEILGAVALLQRNVGDKEASIESYAKLIPLTQGEQKLENARALADLQAEMERYEESIATYKIVLELDPEDFEAVANVSDLAEKAEQWEDFVEYHAQLVELEGDEEEASIMALRQAEVLVQKLHEPEKAMAALAPLAQQGDEACQKEYERLGDELNMQGEVAESLVEWMQEAPAGERRNATLRRAYEKFLEVENRARAIEVCLELIRTKAADEELAKSLEETATPEKNTEALLAAFDVLGRDLTGPPRAEEMVRQAEVLAEAGMNPAEAILHGEQALTSTSPDEVEPLLARLAALGQDNAAVVGVYERQVTRCKSLEERLSALCRAAEVAAEREDLDRVKQFFEIALQATGPREGFDLLRERANKGDVKAKSTVLRETLVQVLSGSGKGARDGGKNRAGFLALAAEIAYVDLKRVEEAFERLGEALVAHADEEKLDQLEQMGEAEEDLERVVEVIGKALEQVHDGPLVRMLLRRRFELRDGKLGDDAGAAEDLKKLYDLSPSDVAIAEQLEKRYEDADDHRGLVHLYEDQILRGRDQTHRSALARKVALLWQDVLDEPREAADAWRRVLRMNAGDAEAKEGLSRAKQAMRRISVEEVAKGEAETRKELEAQQVAEAEEAARRQEELERKAAQLKARHSQPPPVFDDEDLPKTTEEALGALDRAEANVRDAGEDDEAPSDFEHAPESSVEPDDSEASSDDSDADESASVASDDSDADEAASAASDDEIRSELEVEDGATDALAGGDTALEADAPAPDARNQVDEMTAEDFESDSEEEAEDFESDVEETSDAAEQGSDADPEDLEDSLDDGESGDSTKGLVQDPSSDEEADDVEADEDDVDHADEEEKDEDEETDADDADEDETDDEDQAVASGADEVDMDEEDAEPVELDELEDIGDDVLALEGEEEWAASEDGDRRTSLPPPLPPEASEPPPAVDPIPAPPTVPPLPGASGAAISFKPGGPPPPPPPLNSSRPPPPMPTGRTAPPPPPPPKGGKRAATPPPPEPGKRPPPPPPPAAKK